MKNREASPGLNALFVILCVGLALIMRENYMAAGPGPVEPDDRPDPPAQSVGYARLTLAFAGDIVVHSGINDEAYLSGGGYDYLPVMSGAKETLGPADIAVGCLETTLTDGPEYFAYPMFKSPAVLAKGLRDVGFDLISTAGNHCLDDLKPGIDRTLGALEEYGLMHVGTYRTQAERDGANGITVMEKNGVSVAFLAYTFGTNGIDKSEFPYAVNVYTKNYTENRASVIDYEILRADMAAAREMNCDFIAVIMHWGTEYEIKAGPLQVSLAGFLFSEGADMVLGSHPHVPQQMEFEYVRDNEGQTKKRFVCYSLGNFISCMRDRYTYVTAVARIELVKNSLTGEAYIGDAGYEPFFMTDLREYGAEKDGRRYMLSDIHKEIDSFDPEDPESFINAAARDAMLAGLYDLHSILGKEYDNRMRSVR